jgi:hypothetical protein
MSKLFTKIKSAVSNAAIFAAGVFMVGLGFAFVGTIALFGLVAVGAALVASLFVTRPTADVADAETVA